MALEVTSILLDIFGFKLDKAVIKMKILQRYYLCWENIDTFVKCKGISLF